MLRGVTGLTSGQVASRIGPAYRSGAYYGASSLATVSGTVAADTIYAMPLIIRRPVTVQFLAMRVGVSVPAVTGKGAFYTDILADGRLIAEGNNTVDMNAAGGSVVGVIFASNPTLQPGIVWAAWKFNGAAQPVCLDPASQANVPLWEMFGQPNAVPFFAAGTAVASGRRSDAYANAFPATFGAVTWTAGAPGAPVTSWQAV